MMKNSSKKNLSSFSRKSLLPIFVAAILSFSIVFYSDMMISNSATAQNATAANNQTQAGQLSFFLKLADGSNQTAAQTSDPANLKNITVNVNVQQGQEPPKKLPITALVPKATTLEQLELCGSVGDQPEQCQPLSGESISLDLTGGQQAQNGTTAPTTQSQSYQSLNERFKFTNVVFNDNNINNYGFSSAVYSPNDAYFVPVQLLADDVNVNIPIDIDVVAIIPIDIEIENAQICANLGGTQTCQINNINPTTYEFSPTTIDLASQEPTVTTQPAPTTSTTAPTTSTTAPTTSTTAPTTSEPTSTTAPTTSTTAPTTSTTAPTTSTTAPTTSTTEPTPEDSTTPTDSTGTSDSENTETPTN